MDSPLIFSTTRSKRIYGPALPKNEYPERRLIFEDEESDEEDNDLIDFEELPTTCDDSVLDYDTDDTDPETQEYSFPPNQPPPSLFNFGSLQECSNCFSEPCECPVTFGGVSVNGKIFCEICLKYKCNCNAEQLRERQAWEKKNALAESFTQRESRMRFARENQLGCSYLKKRAKELDGEEDVIFIRSKKAKQ